MRASSSDLVWAGVWEVLGVLATAFAAHGTFERVLTFVSFHALAVGYWGAYRASRAAEKIRK